MDKKKIISIVNQKGGVGKTTTVMNMAGALSSLNYKILVVDFDPQGNASSGLGVELSGREKNIYDVLINGLSINEAIINTSIENLDLITSDMNLAAAEMDMIGFENRESILKNIIDQINSKYDYILIDCPPSLGLLTLNALVASDSIIIPLQCEFFALEGLTHLLESAERIKNNFNGKLKINGVLLTMYDKRNKLTEQVEKDVRDCLGKMVFDTVIPRNIKLAESSSYGIPAILYDPNCIGSQAYIKFIEELVKRNG